MNKFFGLHQNELVLNWVKFWVSLKMGKITRWLSNPSHHCCSISTGVAPAEKSCQSTALPQRHFCASFGHWWQSITKKISPSGHHLVCLYCSLDKGPLLQTSSTLEQAVIGTSKNSFLWSSWNLKVPFWIGTGQMENSQAEKAENYDLVNNTYYSFMQLIPIQNLTLSNSSLSHLSNNMWILLLLSFGM